MTKRKILRLSVNIFACIFICAVAVGIFLYTRLPKGRVEMTGTVVDNDYNNFLVGGDLVRIDDKLYYNYCRNEYAYGLMEISKSGSKRIFWDGWMFAELQYLHPIRQHDGKLVMAFDDKLQFYSPDTDAFETYDPLNSIPKMTLCYQTVGQKLLYRQAADPQVIKTKNGGNLAVYEASEVSIIADPDVMEFYALGDEIYYYVFDSYLNTREFRKYNLTGGTDVSVCILDGYGFRNISSLMIEDNYLIFTASKKNSNGYLDGVYKIDLNISAKNLPINIETVCTEDTEGFIHSYNAYDGRLYVTSNSGLAVYDVATNAGSKLYDKAVQRCYIVDDTWVYFTSEGGLWRISQAGGTAEKVFG